MPKPAASIILPTYNRLYCIRRAINSVLKQTFQSWELIIVDDGSTDGTYRILKKELRDPRIRIIRGSHGGSVGKALNSGLQKTHAPLITFLNSDDWYLPAHLKKHLDIFSQDKALALTTSKAELLGSPYVPDMERPGKMIHLDKCVIGGTFFIRKHILQAVGGFPQKPFEDYYLFHKIKNAGYKIMRRRLRTYVYDRRGKDSLTKRLARR
jgi:glycosyltransferase involved in cell wall biosynthesis